MEPAEDPREMTDASDTSPPDRGLRRWWRTLALEDDVLDSAQERRSTLRMVVPLVLPILMVAAIVVLREPDNTVAQLSLLYGAVAIAYAGIVNALQRRVEQVFWIEIANTAVLAALISAVLWTYVTFEHPRPHLHWVVFFLYFLLIGAVGLSDDPRQPVFAGVFSIAGYLAVLPLLDHAARSGLAPMAERLAPEFEWVGNIARVALLAAATVMGTTSASRGRAVRRMSLRDGLTGLLNRHAFDRCLRGMARRAERRGLPMTIAMIDIDHFKQLNDVHGHAAGDAVLRWVGRWLLRSFRSTDVVARYGGEEFVVAFLDTDAEHLSTRLESLRQGIQAAAFRELESDEELRITVSIGMARLPGDGASVEEVLACADERMYRAKDGGRDRVVGGVGAPRPV